MSTRPNNAQLVQQIIQNDVESVLDVGEKSTTT